MNFPNPHLETPTHPSTPEVLWAREHTPTPSPSAGFIFGFTVESIKELGVASPVNICPRDWKQDLQMVGWQLFKGKRSLCMMIGGKWEGRKKRYLNLLFEKGNKNRKGNKYVSGCVVGIRTKKVGVAFLKR
jgi:hypothetical protein